MRKLLMSTLLSLACIVPALGQDASQDQPTAPNATPEQTEPLKDATQAIQKLIQAQLAVALVVGDHPILRFKNQDKTSRGTTVDPNQNYSPWIIVGRPRAVAAVAVVTTTRRPLLIPRHHL